MLIVTMLGASFLAGCGNKNLSDVISEAEDEAEAKTLVGKDDCVIVKTDDCTVYGETEAKAGREDEKTTASKTIPVANVTKTSTASVFKTATVTSKMASASWIPYYIHKKE